MPGFIAKKLCPSLVLIKPNMEKYREASGQLENVLAEYDANYRMLGLDEGFFDLTAHLSSTTPPSNNTIEQLLTEIRQKIFAATGGLTASAGLAANRHLAKVGVSLVYFGYKFTRR